MHQTPLRRAALTAAMATAFLAGCASAPIASTAPAKMSAGLLTDAKGITLYTFDRDVAGTGKSVCNGDCERNWPAYYVPAGMGATGEYTVIQRDDGKAQWAFKGKPLYYWPEDTEPGDKFGDGYNQLWRVIGPAGPVTVQPQGNADGY